MVLAMRLVGANPNAPARGMDQLPGTSNYFIGNDPNQWHIHVPTYAKVKYDNVYPGVDLIYYGNQGQLEYDFVVEPVADPCPIALELYGTVGAVREPPKKAHQWPRRPPLRIDRNGDLVVQADGGEVRFRRPVVYQPVAGSSWRGPGLGVSNPKSKIQNRKSLDGQYVLRRNNQVTFKVAAYDHTRPLVIDPALEYSTYLGGSGDDGGEDIALDSSGNAYITGSTTSTNFPTKDPEQGTISGMCPSPQCGDAFVTKIKADGSALVYSTYLGGTNVDVGYAIAVDGSDNAYVAGGTFSSDFPTKNGFQMACSPGPVGCVNIYGFVTKLDQTGSLVYSSYLGGTDENAALGIAADSSGEAYVTGYTFASNFPVKNALPNGSACNPNCTVNSEAFVTKFNATGNALVYSTFLGGTGGDQGTAIALDASGGSCTTASPCANIVGQTTSNDFPTTKGAYQTSYGGLTDAFISKLSFDPTTQKLSLAYSTYLGGSSTDEGLSIAVDSSGNAYVAGVTNSGDFPVVAGAAGTFQGTAGGGYDGFVAKLDSAGKTLVYSTYLGGSGDDILNTATGLASAAIAVDSSGRAYVTGFTRSTNFPLANPIELTAGQGGALVTYDGSKYAGNGDAFISRLTATGCGVTFSTYLGGHATDAGAGIALDSVGDAYVAGLTASNDFPTVGPYQSNTGGGIDAFVAKATAAAAAATCLLPAKLTFSSQVVGTTSAAQTVTLTNDGDVKLNISGFTANPSQEFAETDTCDGSVDVGKNCSISVTFTPAVGGNRTGTITINDDDSSSANPHTIALTGTGADFQVSNKPMTATVTAGQSTSPVTVTLTPVGRFNAMVSMSCTGLPTGVTCSFVPTSVNVSGSSTTSTLVISTTARSSRIAPRPVPYGLPEAGPPFLTGLGLWLAGLLLLVLLAVTWAGYRQPRRAGVFPRPRSLTLAALLGATLLLVLVWSSCVSGGPGTPTGTPAGTYTVAVTGTSGSLTHNAALTLTVQ
jgi:hypothetical protein